MRIALIALCLAACAPEPLESRASTPGVPAMVPNAPAKPPRISGAWRLVEMNGRSASEAQGEADPPTPIAMTVGDFSFRAQSQCVAFWKRYEWRGDRLVVTDANPGAMCARGLSAWETEFGRTLSSVTGADATDRILRLSGPATTLTFESAPSPPRERFVGRWRLRSVHGAAPPVGDLPLEITVTEDAIRANACVFPGWRYRQDGTLLEVTEIPSSVCERTSTPLETRFAAFMKGLTRATLLNDGALILDSAAEQLEFARVE